MEVIKRDGKKEEFKLNKITDAIMKAFESVKYINFDTFDVSLSISVDIFNYFQDKQTTVTVREIEKEVVKRLIEKGENDIALSYEGYRAVQEFKRKTNTTDNDIMSLISGKNEEVQRENSNKNATINPTQRDLIAGEISKDIARRKLVPSNLVQAHDDGAIHIHDLDYLMQPMFNCCVANIKDMLDNGTVINGNMIESPKSFQVACTVMTQIIAQISSGQYGGQSMNIKHLGKYLRKTIDKNKKLVNDLNLYSTEKARLIRDLTKKELSAGVQTIQYQINTLMTTNGQSPFLTLFLELDKDDEYLEEVAMIIEEILEQRIIGIKNEVGVYITPSFPKLVYVLDEHNNLSGGKYDYITKLAARCSAKRLYPDYISAKKMRENYEGNVFAPMGCRSFLSPMKDENDNYKFEGRFNQGVVTLNLPQIGIQSNGNMTFFWNLINKRAKLCYDALMVRHNLLKGVTSDVSPIHWQHGGVARLKKGEKIDKLLENGYSTLSLGYIGLYELTKIMTGESHTSEKGKKFAVEVMNYLSKLTKKWKKDTGLGFGLYGTPAESLCYRFAKIDKEKNGNIEDVTDKGYYTNSYHVDVREKIDAFSKLEFENIFQPISSGGCISYIEIPNMNHNIEAIEEIIKFIYENIQYAEFNTKSDFCQVCSFDGEIIINDDGEWECPNCGNKEQSKMNVTRRTCGYLGSNYWNSGKTKEIKLRVLHL